MAILSACLWGFSGNVTEYIFKNSDIIAYGLVAVRMFISGIILTIFSLFLVGTKDIKLVLKNKNIMMKLIYYSVCGVILTQLPFFLTIKYSSAAFATLLQFMTPILIIIFGVTMRRIKPKKIEYIVTFTAFFGTFLILTNGSIKELSVSPLAVFWGLLSAIGFAIYLLYEKNLHVIDKVSICGFSMLVGGFILMPFVNYSNLFNSFLDYRIVIALFINVVLGTVIPFYMFLKSLDYIPPRTTSLLGCFEPLTSLVIAYLFFNTVFGNIQLLGSCIIIISIIVLSL